MDNHDSKVRGSSQVQSQTVGPEHLVRNRTFQIKDLNLTDRWLQTYVGHTGPGVAPPTTSGFRVNRGSLLSVEIRWNETLTRWEYTNHTGAVFPFGILVAIASSILTDTTNFDHILSAADTDVQLALETLDDHFHPDFWSGLRTSPGKMVFVDVVNGTDSLTRGMFTAPYQTLNYALSKTTNGDTIFIFPGTYGEVLNYNDQSRWWVGLGGPNSVRIGGNFGGSPIWKLSGSAWSSPQYFSNITFFNSNGGATTKVFHFDSTYRTTNLCLFENCIFENSNSMSGYSVSTDFGTGVAGTRTSTVSFVNCSFDGIISIYRDPGVDASILSWSFHNSYGWSSFPEIIVDDQSTHNDGTVLFTGSCMLVPNVLATNTATCINESSSQGSKVNRLTNMIVGTTPILMGFGASILLNATAGPITVSVNLSQGRWSQDQLTITCASDYAHRVIFPAGLNYTLQNNVPIELFQKPATGGLLDCASITFGWNLGLNQWTEVSRKEIRDFIYNAGNTGASPAVDWLRSDNWTFTVNNNPATFTFNNPIAGKVYRLKLTQDGVGGKVVALPGTVIWESAVPPILSLAANKVDLLSFFYDGTNYIGTALVDVR